MQNTIAPEKQTLLQQYVDLLLADGDRLGLTAFRTPDPIWSELISDSASATTTAAFAQQTPTTAGVFDPGSTTFVEAGRLLADPANGVVQRDKTLVIRGNQVVEIRDGFVGDAAQGRVIDLHQAFVLPGLIDSHVHLTSDAGGIAGQLEEVTLSPAAQAFTKLARGLITAGIA